MMTLFSLHSIWERLRSAWARAAALRELQRLYDRMLKDIGLHRGELEGIAFASAQRGTCGRFGAVRLRRLERADLSRCLRFGRQLHPEDIRGRFGRPAALDDDDTFRRLFGLDDGKIETIGAFDPAGEICGLATVARVAPGTAELGFIVRSDLQRRGVGATLLAYVISRARAADVRLLRADIGDGNLPARRLARHFGFEFAGSAVNATHAELLLRG